jgi:hypothetical protein
VDISRFAFSKTEKSHKSGSGILGDRISQGVAQQADKLHAVLGLGVVFIPEASMTSGEAFKNVKFPNAKALGNCVNHEQLNIFEDST